MSRIGKKPVELPKGVTASISGQTIEVKGPKGTRSFTATDDVTITIEDGREGHAARHLQACAPAVGHGPVDGRNLVRA
jgi:ribosomal protein L6P/L9E